MELKKKETEKYSLIRDLKSLFDFLSDRRKVQIVLVLILMVLSSFSEVISLGAIFPFLSAISNPDAILNNPKFQSTLSILTIETAEELITTLAIIFIIAVLLANGIRLITINSRVNLAADIGTDISTKIYHNTLGQNYTFHVNHNSSDLMQTVIDDTNKLTKEVLIPLIIFFNESLIVLSILITLFVLDTKIAVGSTAILGGTYIVIYITRLKILQSNSKIITEASQRKIQAVQEGLGGIKDILLNHNQDFFENVYEKSERAYKKATASNLIIAQSPRYIIEAVTLSTISLFVLRLGINGNFTNVIPMLGGLALGAQRLFPSLQQVFSSLARIQGSRASLERVILALNRAVPSLISQVDLLTPMAMEREIKLENISFRYGENSNWVLKNLNLRIPAKTMVGFVGSTGSGKSTTIDLILGLLKPSKGRILVDNLPLDGENLYRWQKCVAYVPQSIFLCDGTIAENIAFGVAYKQINLEQIKKVARLAQIDDFIEGLPAKYDTYVGERGIRLSGGQRQRIGIARALYGDASVIVFDEATSALDNITEKEVMKAIENLSHDFTIILIAHRLSTLEKCHCIFELSHGQVMCKN